jgi:hypothetical protein
VLSSDNAFKQEVNEIYTDPYCIIREYWTGISLEISERVDLNNYNNNLLMKYYSNEIYNQLHKKQTFYKYFVESDNTNLNINLTNTGYIDNHYNEVMSTPVDIFETAQALESESVLLRIPFIDRDYFYGKPAPEMYEIMDQYFIADYLEDAINYNTQLTQAFHNTIDIPPKYYSYLFEENTMDVLETPVIPIKVELFLNSDAFLTSSYGNITDFEIAVNMEIITFLKEREGFMIDFFETDLEKHIYNTFSPIIRNIKVGSPTLFRVNNAAVVYEGIQNNLEFKDLLDFIPPYFYYDYNNIDLTINM